MSVAVYLVKEDGWKKISAIDTNDLIYKYLSDKMASLEGATSAATA